MVFVKSLVSEPCLDCGACCATFRVSFYWTEADASLGGTVPEELVTQSSPLAIRCDAWNGRQATAVYCPQRYDR